MLTGTRHEEPSNRNDQMRRNKIRKNNVTMKAEGVAEIAVSATQSSQYSVVVLALVLALVLFVLVLLVLVLVEVVVDVVLVV